MEEIMSSLAAYSPTQWIALATGLAYVILAAYQKPLCWPFGIVSCTLIAIDDFTVYRLYADGVLQIFYVVFGFAGLYFWVFKRQPGDPLPVSSESLRTHAIAIALAAIVSIPLAWLLATYTSAAFSYLDTITTILSLWATWLLVRKVFENWLYWIAIDAVYVVLFWQRGGDLVAVLYAIYLVVAVVGFLQWRKSRESVVHA